MKANGLAMRSLDFETINFQFVTNFIWCYRLQY